MMYVSVIIPRPLEGTFTYRVPPQLESRVAVGKRVIVPFGPRRYVTGITESIHFTRPADVASIKDVTDILDESPTVIHPQIKLWHWLADYYMCPVGDVFKAAVPAGLKLESESVVEPADDALPEVYDTLGDDDMKIVSAVRAKGKMSLKDLARSIGKTSVETAVSRLVGLGVLEMHESVVNRYRRIKVSKVMPLIPKGDNAALQGAFEAVKRSEGQQKALLQIIALSGFNNATVHTRPVSRADLLDVSSDFTWEHVLALKRKGLVDIRTYEVSRFSPPEDGAGAFAAPLPVLSGEQSRALREIHDTFVHKAVTLLHGVTSSGKTEIYIHLIDHVMRQGRQVLFLVPEIALTTQLTRRLQRVFGPLVKIYHSKFTDNERVDIWRDMLAHPGPCVVVGARSSLFLPFSNLGLVIVDEEHEPSYKQYDPAPRYNGRDAAIVLASFHGAKTLLGSATPTVETYYKATEGAKYGLVNLHTRYGDVHLPEIEVIDIASERRKRAVDGAFSNRLVAEGRHMLRDGRQLIFFHNRRGFSPRARCRMCQFVPKCDHCDVSLTYHKSSNTLECHYCGAAYPVPKVCPNCHEPAMEIEGYGTERVEDGVSALYPEARILRLDLDTTRSKEAYAQIIDDFSAHKADILVGTQMVTKGLDFGDVGLVGVINADNVINYPDFRSSERAFNMLEQVSGRAGRRAGASGKVMIQTSSPDHPVIGYVRAHDYRGFYEYELEQRRSFVYPPFSRVINIFIRHRDRAVVHRFASDYAARLRALLGNRVNGPVEPPVARVASQYIMQVMLRIEADASIKQVKAILRSVYVDMNSGVEKSGATVYYDVDPV
ncbi:MAG: primosomal protein N' [Muribaculaceae bacterium]|nr:primosomal protein N' [Muribaculaceae bacterium]